MKLILNGGGSAEKTKLINQLFNNIIDNNKPVLYIPLAMEFEKYHSCLDWITNELSIVQFNKIDMISNANDINNINLSNYGAIFIGGGNTFKLLSELKASGVFEKIKKFAINDGVIFGGSAGSIIFGKDISVCEYMDENLVLLNDTSGFNLINEVSLVAHYTNQNEEKHKRATEFLLEYSQNNKIIALPEEDSLYINNDLYQVVGTKDYYLFYNKKIIKLSPNIEYSKQEFNNLFYNL